MFNLQAISTLLLATFLIGNASPLTTTTIGRRDDPIEEYKAHIGDVDKHNSASIKCYNDYVAKVKEKSPPNAAVVAGMSLCDEDYDLSALALHKARRLAFAPNFPTDKLFENKLPDVTDGRKNWEGDYTRKLAESIDEAEEASTKAFEAYQTGMADLSKVTEAIKKKATKEFDVSNATIKYSKNSGGMSTAVAVGVIIAGVPIVGGVVTFQPFVTAAGGLGSAIEAVDTALTTAGDSIAAIEGPETQSLTVQQIAKARNAIAEADRAVGATFTALEDTNNQLVMVPGEEAVEAEAIVQTHIQQMDEVVAQIGNLRTRYINVRNQVISLIS
ncbi:hypothetical protein XA68_17433 [Ophiocordyceps unilateralis]|uniref:Uncharacterized protein n=1 Tax=Ophiocordyceps unilateralis TaxID=268505 RepID=A0A2A9P4K6_OPHUN|nr:hypothetical protein XA68_17433 [Ophiocordyceps unilateralis]